MDKNNHGPSYIIALCEYEGGRQWRYSPPAGGVALSLHLACGGGSFPVGGGFLPGGGVPITYRTIPQATDNSDCKQ